MSETEHIKNLLIKGLQEKKEIDEKTNYVEPRLGIKGAAIQVVDSLIEVIKLYLEEESVSDLSARYFMYADGSDTVFVINESSVIDLPPSPVGDFFEEIPDLLITLTASTKSPGGLSPSKADAIYVHDPDNIDDAGEIEMFISLPSGSKNILEYLTTKRTMLCGVLTHEMQHVVQKMVCGYTLSLTTGEDLDTHAFDPREIDARVEESITLMGDNEHEEDEVKFSEALITCINEYLDRNASPEKATELRDKMLVEHMIVYKKKMQALL